MAVKSHGSAIVLPALAAMSAAIVAGGVSGCSSGRDYYANCVDPVTHKVVPSYLCEDNSNYYIWMAPRSYGTGYYVPTSYRSGSGWFRASDSTARSKAGLPSTGTIGSGYKVKSGSGGFDGVHSSSGGGFHFFHSGGS